MEGRSSGAEAVMPEDPRRRLLAFLAAATLAAIVAFLAMPGLDIRFSALFWSPGSGFGLQRSRPMLLGRDAFRLAFDLCALGVLVMLLATSLGRGAPRVPARVWGFLAAALAIGPGLIANVALKENWGRARPDAVEAFGGASAFTPPFVPSDACLRNCAFVSGEGSAWAALSIAFGVLLYPNLAGRARVWTIAGLALAAILAGGGRIAMGRHWLSDTVFGALICAWTVALLYPLFRIGAVRHRFTPGNVLRDVADGLRAAGGRVRQLLPER
jgi:lipid A 4'-phosphatase